MDPSRDLLASDIISMSATESGMPSAHEANLRNNNQVFEVNTGTTTMEILRKLQGVTTETSFIQKWKQNRGFNRTLSTHQT